MYPLLLKTVRAAMADLEADGFEPTLEGFFWHQGENDCGLGGIGAAGSVDMPPPLFTHHLVAGFGTNSSGDPTSCGHCAMMQELSINSTMFRLPVRPPR